MYFRYCLEYSLGRLYLYYDMSSKMRICICISDTWSNASCISRKQAAAIKTQSETIKVGCTPLLKPTVLPVNHPNKKTKVALLFFIFQSKPFSEGRPWAFGLPNNGAESCGGACIASGITTCDHMWTADILLCNLYLSCYTAHVNECKVFCPNFNAAA